MSSIKQTQFLELLALTILKNVLLHYLGWVQWLIRVDGWSWRLSKRLGLSLELWYTFVLVVHFDRKTNKLKALTMKMAMTKKRMEVLDPDQVTAAPKKVNDADD